MWLGPARWVGALASENESAVLFGCTRMGPGRISYYFYPISILFLTCFFWFRGRIVRANEALELGVAFGGRKNRV
jgi:hypothetical protein